MTGTCAGGKPVGRPARLGALVLALGASSLSAQPDEVSQPPDPDSGLARVGAFQVSDIRVQGSSVFTPQELAAFTAPYANRLVSLEELHELRHTLSRAYVERGYVSSGVVIPDQRVEGGSVRLQAIEGRLVDIDVRGNRRLHDGAIERRVSRGIGTPFDIADLQTNLRLLQEDPSVERVNARLLPGDAPGQSRLELAIVERRPLDLEVAAGNDRSATVGEHRGTVTVTYRGLIGNGDVLSGRFGFTEGVADDALSYRVPLGAGGTALEISAADQESDIVEEPFDDIDISSELASWSVTASRPFVRRTDGMLTGFVGFEHKHSESTLLGLPFSFSPGDVNGKAEGSAVMVGAEWTRRRPTHAWAARGTWRVGVDVLDPTIAAAGPDSKFVAFVGQLQHVRDIGPRDGRLLVHGLVQTARDPLLAMYKLPVGGRYSVRGYRENQLVRDNGVTASLEYQFAPLVDEVGRARGNFRLALFTDYGLSWDEDDALPTSDEEHIASVGLGLLWDPLPGLHMEVYRGADLEDRDNPTDTLQDRGIHYRLSFDRSFR